MDHEERLRHASSFGAAAVAYAEHRPDYAQAAVGWALEPVPGLRVLDLGAGTGKLTATLVALGAEVVAVEPDPAMLAELRHSLPVIRALQGSAEAIPLPDASVDAVLAGNAMHWFDMATAGPEIARVLTPGGVLAGLWNVMDDQTDWSPNSHRSADPRPSAPGTPPPAGAPKQPTCTSRNRAAPPDSAHPSKPRSPTDNAAPPTPSSQPSPPEPESSSCRNTNNTPPSAGSTT